MDEEQNSDMQVPCCSCENRGKCKSCRCNYSGGNCTNCRNPNCHFKSKSTSNISAVARRRHHPYASNSPRNATQPSPNQQMESRSRPENERDAQLEDQLTIRVNEMTETELRTRVLAACRASPETMQHFIIGPPQQMFVLSSVPWCICGYCRSLEEDRMNFCCGHALCLTQSPAFRNLCLRHDVIEVANILNWAFRTNGRPSLMASTFRNQAYRNFVMWQHGTLGAGNRVPVPLCVCVAIRSRFPEPSGRYTGYHSANSDSD